MQLHIESPHIEPNEGLMTLIRRKFDHLARRYDRIDNCDVVLRKEKSSIQEYFYVEAKMELPKVMLFSSDRADSFEIAINKIIDDLEHQLRRYKEELEERR